MRRYQRCCRTPPAQKGVACPYQTGLLAQLDTGRILITTRRDID
jgi:hypothetical protein